MKVEFHIVVGMIGGHGDGGDCFVELALTEEECARLKAYAKENGDLYLGYGESVADIAARVDAEFKDQQLQFIDRDLLEQYAKENDLDPDEMDEDEQWDAFCSLYSYSVLMPDEFEEDDEEAASER